MKTEDELFKTLAAILGILNGMLDSPFRDAIRKKLKEKDFLVTVLEDTRDKINALLDTSDAGAEVNKSEDPILKQVTSDPIIRKILLFLLNHPQEYGFILCLFDPETSDGQHYSNGDSESQIFALENIIKELKKKSTEENNPLH